MLAGIIAFLAGLFLLAFVHRSETRLLEGIQLMSAELTTLQQKVADNSTVIDSAITLIQGIKAKLDAAIAANDPKALQALSDALGAEDQKLADAIVANTPAEE
jgi:hypothetical protein